MGKPLAIALMSGGLDSLLAARIMLDQGFDVIGLAISTPFFRAEKAAQGSADLLGIPLRVYNVGEDYYEMLANPRYGYGKASNPCIDCHAYMCRVAGEVLRETGADVVVTGEVVSQRPMSQMRNSMAAVFKQSGLKGKLLRPLSAKLLDPSDVELSGLADREKLYDIYGRSRGPQHKLAAELGLTDIPGSAGGCKLTEPMYAPRVFDLLENQLKPTAWHYEQLNLGRQFRFDPQTKMTVGRNQETSEAIRALFDRDDAPAECAIMTPIDMKGPDIMIQGNVSDEAVRFAGGLMRRYGRVPEGAEPTVELRTGDETRELKVQPLEAAEEATLL